VERRIAHLDMDAFYSIRELLRYPQLKAWRVVVGGGRRPARSPGAGPARSLLACAATWGAGSPYGQLRGAGFGRAFRHGVDEGRRPFS